MAPDRLENGKGPGGRSGLGSPRRALQGRVTGAAATGPCRKQEEGPTHQPPGLATPGRKHHCCIGFRGLGLGSPVQSNGSTPRGVVLRSSSAQMAGLGDAYGGYEDAITDLEAVLEQGREVLDPATIAVLEENLGTIDQAIQEAGEALAKDPASTVLQRILGDNIRLKVEVLRKAAVAVYATT